jgi:hypothetical protein
MQSTRSAVPTSGVLYECEYGRFRPPFLWFFGIVGILGLIAVPVGLFANTGWEVGNRPMEPWAATLMIEIFALIALAIGAAALLSSLLRDKIPQRVAVTSGSLIVPQGMFSTAERELPFAAIKRTVFHVGFVRQLQIMHGRKKIILTSAAFPSEAHFDRMLDHLPK